MGCGFDLPVTANGVGCGHSGERCVRDVEGGLGGPVPQATRNDAGEHFAFDANDRGDVRMPFCAGEFFGRIEDRDGAPFVAIAALGTTADSIDRGRCRGDFLDLLVQCRLIVLDPRLRGAGSGRSAQYWPRPRPRRFFLAMQSIHRDDCPVGQPEFGEQFLRRWNLV